MKTLLIVEDEKLIRQGIRVMVQRSGVPIDTILECSNGEDALETLKNQQVDVMFTDIRMPKMDGIELVKRVQELEHKPYMVAVSGYDDFSYAVEMLRNGVQEYILKPVEREKIVEVLKKLDEKITSQKNEHVVDRKIGRQQIKYLLLNSKTSEAEIALLKQKHAGTFYPEGYVICQYEANVEIEENEAITEFTDVCEGSICIVDAQSVGAFLKSELPEKAVGISSIHHGFEELKEAYQEAGIARRCAFVRMKPVSYEETLDTKIPQGLIENAAKLLSEQARMQRMQLIGTEKTTELLEQWDRIFSEARMEHIPLWDFICELRLFIGEVGKIYRNIVTDEQRRSLEKYKEVLGYPDIEAYRDELMDWIIALHEQINDTQDNNRNQQKMKKAVEYVQENYNKDLNMAVVSNYISMNYSMFSFAFKQYTGSNFVNYLKDIRIRKAKQLLAETDMRVIEISREVGYDNEKNFMKIFKSSCGVSPSEYRKNMRHE